MKENTAVENEDMKIVVEEVSFKSKIEKDKVFMNGKQFKRKLKLLKLKQKQKGKKVGKK